MHTTVTPLGSMGDGWPTPQAPQPGPLLGHAPRPARLDDRRAARSARLVAVLAVVSALVLVFTGNLAAAAAPVMLVVACYALWTLPLRFPLYGLILITAVAFEPPRSLRAHYEIQASGALYEAFLKPLQEILNTHLNHTTGIGALAFTGAEALYLLLMALAVLRSLRSERIDAAGRAPSVGLLHAFAGLALVTVLLLEVTGVARGGSAKSSLFQIRHLLFLPLQLALFTYALRDRRDFEVVGVLMTVGACVKIALGVFFFMHDAWPSGLKPENMTAHEDSVLYVVVMFMWIAAWVHRPRARTIPLTSLVVGWVFAGIVLNDRRLAYVSVAGSFVMLYALLRGPIRRRITQTAIALLPVLAVYLVLAKSHTGGIFTPGHEFLSVGDVNDSSNMWREMENYNLLVTLHGHPVVGSGWGHEYVEAVKAADISMYMKEYRLTAHNSLLWLLGVSGIVGFTMLWLPIPIGVFLGARSYYYARTPIERTAAATVVCTIIAYVNLAWGDMGIQSDYATTSLALALALSGKLARATGAWPAGSARLLGTPRRARHDRGTSDVVLSVEPWSAREPVVRPLAQP